MVSPELPRGVQRHDAQRLSRSNFESEQLSFCCKLTDQIVSLPPAEHLLKVVILQGRGL